MDTTLTPTALRDGQKDTVPSSWLGRIVTALPALFLTFDATIKLLQHPAVAEATGRLGLPFQLSFGVGALELTLLALYLLPRTALFGCVLLTGFLGGAVVLHLRIGDPFLTHTLFPIYVGALLWVGLFLRQPRLRRLLEASV